ncbi:GntR family transcriptional regulator [Hankyongella ginsenosidimutans]|uniref:GntR family transcriptional regulator n=1 Tax=Hankyongella ginsenosidimutans TaxID=1763828 RepID=A0A4D7C9X6_9SPHN|nr:GntR family transcriptional regulator [Hankyongella ginsenosidimutans]QCI79883.1 GntR family transcriptional regulator [Hankyongella ginsenosidimutans]TXG85563.1 MAG: GntR family transcriptional regulator [Sphingomonadales bacterium]
MTPIWREHQPIYRQIRSYIVTMILDGLVDQSKPLPSVRTLAGKLQVNPLTVSKAYQDLQADGFVEARRGLGMFVTDDARARLLAAEREAFLREEWPDLLRRIEQLELTPADLFRRSTALA